VQLSFIRINPGFQYTVTVFGVADFDPIVAVETAPGVGDCNDDAPAAAGSEIAVPGLGNLVSNNRTAQVRFTTSSRSDSVVNITVGAVGGGGGQYVMVLEGLAISPSTELDGFAVRVPTSVAQDPLSVYMVSQFTDLDPTLEAAQGEGLDQAYDENGDFDPDLVDFNDLSSVAFCDDVAVGDCSDTPAFPGGGVDIANGSRYVAGELDAGLVIIPQSSRPILYIFGSAGGRSAGQYAIMIIGTVPGALGSGDLGEFIDPGSAAQ
jgi:hypothetical protein